MADMVYKFCYLCGQKFVGLHKLTKHLREHDSGATCSQCSQVLTDGFSLHEHMRNHFREPVEPNQSEAAEKSKRYQCRDCPYFCYTAKTLGEHSRKQHHQKPFECSHCGMRYMHKATLEEHFRSKHSYVEPSIPCDKCEKKFFTKTSLFAHRRDQHMSGDRRVKCDVCNLWYKGARNLRKHKETHRPEAHKKFVCLYCNKTFRTRNNLTVHERVHTGETPYRCHVCPKNFKRSHHLYGHLKCADHLSKMAQLEAEGQALPNPIYSVAPSSGPAETSVNVTTAADAFTEPIYMEVTQVEGSNTVQVVVPGIEAHQGTMTTDQLLQSAFFLSSSEEYRGFEPQ